MSRHVHDEIYTSLLPHNLCLAKALQRRGCFFPGDLEGMEWVFFAFAFFSCVPGQAFYFYLCLLLFSPIPIPPFLQPYGLAAEVIDNFCLLSFFFSSLSLFFIVV